MKRITKYAVAAALTGALAIAAATPSQARWHHGGWGAAGAGFAAGALIGAAAATAYGPGYYGPAYYYGPGPYYYDEGSYAYEPAPVYSAPAYEPAPVYSAPRSSQCWHFTDKDRGFGYYGACP